MSCSPAILVSLIGVLLVGSAAAARPDPAPARPPGQVAAPPVSTSPGAKPAVPAASRPRPASGKVPAAVLAAMQPVPNPPAVKPGRVRARPAHTRRQGGVAALANAQARDWPTPSAYVNSALFYDFEPGRIYTIQTSPRFLTTIQLRPGERLIAKAAGDTVRWVLGETVAGAGETAQVTIFVKPIRPGLRTNIVLTTNQRTYLIDASSNALANYTSVLAWNYPQDEARTAEAAQAALAPPLGPEAACATSTLANDRLNFRYRIDPRGRRAPDWTPVRVFDDGQKTCIEFPADLSTRAAPPLFLLGAKDRAELVNYRQAGVYYVVDRLIDRAELRLGERRQDVVRITRQGGGR